MVLRLRLPTIVVIPSLSLTELAAGRVVAGAFSTVPNGGESLRNPDWRSV